MEPVIIRSQDTPSISCLSEVCATFRSSLFLKLNVKTLTLTNQMKTEFPVSQYMLSWHLDTV